jgi:hypothetical protein
MRGVLGEALLREGRVDNRPSFPLGEPSHIITQSLCVARLCWHLEVDFGERWRGYGGALVS